MAISFCLKCKKEVSDTLELCECGSTSFVYCNEKKVFTFDDEGNVVCQCGESNFKRGMHLDYTNKSDTTYTCANCSCVIGVESYRDEESRMYWE